MLSMDNSGTNAVDGNGYCCGDGLIDIKSGDGQNFVTSGKADIDGDGQADLDLINRISKTTNTYLMMKIGWLVAGISGHSLTYILRPRTELLNSVVQKIYPNL